MYVQYTPVAGWRTNVSVNQKTNNRQVEDALQVFTLVILEARLVTRDAIRRITEYKVVTASMMYRIPTSEIGIYQHLVVLLPTDSIKLLNLR